MIKIGLSGAAGRMGMVMGKLIEQKTDKFILAAKHTRSSTDESLEEMCNHSDVIIDFSHVDNLQKLTKILAKSTAKLVVGTTGLEQKHMKYLEELSTTNAVLHAPNTSIGANLVAMLSGKAAKLLKGYDVEIIEAHHKYKKDAPSGTALMIGQRIADATNVDFADKAVFDRAKRGERLSGEIGFSSIRGGGIFGDNEVMFAGEDEVISISCRALSRDSFANGALLAAEWLFNKPTSLYSIQDLLKL